MSEIPSLRKIPSYDRYVRKLVEKERMRKLPGKTPRFEAI